MLLVLSVFLFFKGEREKKEKMKICLSCNSIIKIADKKIRSFNLGKTNENAVEINICPHCNSEEIKDRNIFNPYPNLERKRIH